MGWVDTVAHVLYCPTALGGCCERARWHHRLHLIPGALLEWVCTRYDRMLDRSV